MKGFRPLAGIMVLIGTDCALIFLPACFVSVPLRGLWFLSSSASFSKACAFLFPSPCGDYGSYPKARPRSSTNRAYTFPSPCGDYGSYRIEEL